MCLINLRLYGFLVAVLIILAPLRGAVSGEVRQAEPGDELYGGIQVSPECLSVIVLRLVKNGADVGFKLDYSQVIRLALWRGDDGSFAPQASADAAQAISAAIGRLQRQYRVKRDHIYLIGASRLAAEHPADLVAVIRNTTGVDLTFLEEAEETQLRIVGTVPRFSKEGSATIDSRNTSVLLHIGSICVQGGYEFLKYSSAGAPAADFVTMTIPQGVVTYASEISRSVGPNAPLYGFTREIKASSAINFRQALRREVDAKPGLMHRKRVYLTGDLVWAVATIMSPEDRSALVSVTYDDIVQFADKIGASPKELITQDLSFIRDRKVRQDVQQEIEEIKATFLPKQLIAGAEMLKAAAEELKWREKKVIFVRYGRFTTITTYVRVQSSTP